MRARVPLPTALVVLALACAASYMIATSPEPLTLRTYPVEPERNYTLETLRILNPPKLPKVEYYRGPANDRTGIVLSTNMFWPNGDREYARVLESAR